MTQAKTDTMDTRKLLQPVVVERPARGREMKTQDFAEENAMEEGARGATQGEVFHEGYVEGKKFLVPDSNLEAMADMINLKMRRMETSKYVSDSDAMNTDDLEDNYLKKKESLFKKLESLADLNDFSSEESTYVEEEEEEGEEEEAKAEEEKEILEELPSSSSEEDEEEKEVEEEEDEKDKDDGSVEEEEDEDKGKLEKDDQDNKSAGEEDEEVKEESAEEEDLRSAEEVEEESEDEGGHKVISNDEGNQKAQEEVGVDDADGLVPVYYHDPNIKRFLISGHFRSNRKPIYIIQQYEGQSVFKHRDPEFFSHKSVKDVDIFIAGEFFKESILEEDRYKQPIFLSTTPRKVVVDWRSKIYEEKFTDVFIGSEIDVELSGSFIEHSLAALHTPFLTITLRKGTAQATSAYPGTGATVYVMRPIVENIFEKEKTWETTRRKRSRDRRKGRDYQVQDGRRSTGFQYPTGARVSGPMAVYVSHPETHSSWQRSSDDARCSHPTVVRKRDTMRETLLLPETSRRSSARGSWERRNTATDLDTSSARQEHIRRTLTRHENPSEILEAFVKSERDKIREKRQKEREKITMGSILSQLFLSK